MRLKAQSRENQEIWTQILDVPEDALIPLAHFLSLSFPKLKWNNPCSLKFQLFVNTFLNIHVPYASTQNFRHFKTIWDEFLIGKKKSVTISSMKINSLSAPGWSPQLGGQRDIFCFHKPMPSSRVLRSEFCS